MCFVEMHVLSLHSYLHATAVFTFFHHGNHCLDLEITLLPPLFNTLSALTSYENLAPDHSLPRSIYRWGEIMHNLITNLKPKCALFSTFHDGEESFKLIPKFINWSLPDLFFWITCFSLSDIFMKIMYRRTALISWHSQWMQWGKPVLRLMWDYSEHRIVFCTVFNIHILLGKWRYISWTFNSGCVHS